MIKVNTFRCAVIDKFGVKQAVKFMDELEKWDRTVQRKYLFDMYYNEDVLQMLLKQSFE
jgi:hypothetical protein